jgi:hypothetical protein
MANRGKLLADAHRQRLELGSVVGVSEVLFLSGAQQQALASEAVLDPK